MARWATWRTKLGSVVLLTTGLACNSVNNASKNLPLPSGARAQMAALTPKKPGGIQPPLRVAQFIFYADVPLEQADPLFTELEELPDRLQRELRLPAGNNIIQVYLFETQEKYEAFMKDRFPWLPMRRAYFVSDGKRPGAGEDLQVYTWLGEHLRTDLRHELTHALLHNVLAGVPLWLDEGLASFFEQPVRQDGLNPDHLDRLRRNFQVDMPRLEQMKLVSDMEKPEYRESWAWVHFCLRGDDRAKAVLQEYLQQLRTNANPGPLWPKLKAQVADPRASLYEHLSNTGSPTARP
ncbi:MAG: hypothetical protein ACRC8S_03150 [Fimbriiglobus sp.]